MILHLFHSSTGKSQWAATDDPCGQKLPVHITWIYHKAVFESRIGFDAVEAQVVIQKQGFHLFSTTITVKEGAI
jgi:hypothetical protein